MRYKYSTRPCFVLKGLIRNVKDIAVNTLRGMAKVSYMHLTMMVLPGREPDTAINIMTRDRELGTGLRLYNNIE